MNRTTIWFIAYTLMVTGDAGVNPVIEGEVQPNSEGKKDVRFFRRATGMLDKADKGLTKIGAAAKKRYQDVREKTKDISEKTKENYKNKKEQLKEGNKAFWGAMKETKGQQKEAKEKKKQENK